MTPLHLIEFFTYTFYYSNNELALLSSERKGGRLSYKIWKLIDSRFLEDFSKANEHLICDIDKTYLETTLDSLVKLAKIPFEKAREKITVSGAKELLQAYRHL